MLPSLQIHQIFAAGGDVEVRDSEVRLASASSDHFDLVSVLSVHLQIRRDPERSDDEEIRGCALFEHETLTCFRFPFLCDDPAAWNGLGTLQK